MNSINLTAGFKEQIENLGLVPFDGKKAKQCKLCKNKSHLLNYRKTICGCLVFTFYCCGLYGIYDIAEPCSQHNKKSQLTNFQKAVQAFKSY